MFRNELARLGGALTAMLAHGGLRRKKRGGGLSRPPASAADAAIARVDLMMTVVIGVAAIEVVLVYRPCDLSSRGREVFGTSGAEP